MTNEEFRKIKPGDMIRHVITGETYHVELIEITPDDSHRSLVCNRIIVIEESEIEEVHNWERFGEMKIV
jgi:hypothetical protein